MVVYIDEFKCNLDIAAQFSGSRSWYDDNRKVDNTVTEAKSILDLLNSSEVLLAWYGGGPWEGEAMVVYKSEGKLYVVTGSHCSCYGLEGQWDPVETNYKVLAMKEPSPFEDQDYVDAYKEMLELIKDD